MRHDEVSDTFVLVAKAARQSHSDISQAISIPSVWVRTTRSNLHANGPLTQPSTEPSAGFTQHRDDERINHTLADQNLRDARAIIDDLHSQIIDLHTRLNDAEHARDKAELRVAVLQLKGAGHHIRARELAARMLKAKRISYEWHPDGTQYTQWLSDDNTEVQVLASPSPRSSKAPLKSKWPAFV